MVNSVNLDLVLVSPYNSRLFLFVKTNKFKEKINNRHKKVACVGCNMEIKPSPVDLDL